MFQFRFLDTDEDNSNGENESPEHCSSLADHVQEAKEVQPNKDLIKEILNTNCISTLIFKNSINIKYIASSIVDLLSSKVQNDPIVKADQNYSDLLAGVYEGGLKIWECTYDLINFIHEQNLDLKCKTVLDLGCGSGIIGILAFINDAKVYFQDFNEDVIKYVTIPNVYLNSVNESTASDKCRFYSGDWSSFLSITENAFETEDRKFDYIFTCETIYNIKSYEKLYAIFKRRLKKSGIIYLAAKTHYFGVGGGLREFEDFIRKENVFTFSTCWKYSNGVQREILKIVFKM